VSGTCRLQCCLTDTIAGVLLTLDDLFKLRRKTSTAPDVEAVVPATPRVVRTTTRRTTLKRTTTSQPVDYADLAALNGGEGDEEEEVGGEPNPRRQKKLPSPEAAAAAGAAAPAQIFVPNDTWHDPNPAMLDSANPFFAPTRGGVAITPPFSRQQQQQQQPSGMVRSRLLLLIFTPERERERERETNNDDDDERMTTGALPTLSLPPELGRVPHSRRRCVEPYHDDSPGVLLNNRENATF
jgi:hypothetical protein